jgi:hypothetical protein
MDNFFTSVKDSLELASAVVLILSKLVTILYSTPYIGVS